MSDNEKVSHLMKGIEEDVYQTLLMKEINTTADFFKWYNCIKDMEQKQVGRQRFKMHPNDIPVAAIQDEPHLVSLICQIL